MSTIVTRLFDTYEHASTAVSELETGGIPHANISLVANNADDRHAGTVTGASPATESAAGTGAGTGATLGTVVGGGAGLLAGLGMLAIPGVGPVVAAGLRIATAVGAGVRRGGTLVTVKAEESQAAMVERVLDAHSPVDTAARGDAYRAEGWNGFDETAPAYTAGAAADMGMPGATTGSTVGTTPGTAPGMTTPPRGTTVL